MARQLMKSAGSLVSILNWLETSLAITVS